MPDISKLVFRPDEDPERRNEILDAAQRLVYSKGYEQMTIQDILDEQRKTRLLLERLITRLEQGITNTRTHKGYSA
jgi:chorismate mutase